MKNPSRMQPANPNYTLSKTYVAFRSFRRTYLPSCMVGTGPAQQHQSHWSAFCSQAARPPFLDLRSRRSLPTRLPCHQPVAFLGFTNTHAGLGFQNCGMIRSNIASYAWLSATHSTDSSFLARVAREMFEVVRGRNNPGETRAVVQMRCVKLELLCKCDA